VARRTGRTRGTNRKEGNVRHIAEHGITPLEAEEVVRDRYEAAVASRSSGRPTVFGWTSTGKYLALLSGELDWTFDRERRRLDICLAHLFPKGTHHFGLP
jgi:hypothetical protein